MARPFHNRILHIGPYRYRVDRSPGNAATLGGDDGAFLADQEVIYVAGSLAPRRALQTLWHEVSHALLDSQGISRHNERTVDAFATALVAFMQCPKNKRLILETMESGHAD